MLNIIFHVLCAAMFFIGGFMSHGSLGLAAYVCTAAIVLEGLAWTGVLGSVIAKVKKK